MKQVARIEDMEAKFDIVNIALKNLDKALNDYRRVQKDFRELSIYYASDEWKMDFEADEDGKLPKDLKRGVLSEDGIYNLLDKNIAIQKKMCKLIDK